MNDPVEEEEEGSVPLDPAMEEYERRQREREELIEKQVEMSKGMLKELVQLKNEVKEQYHLMRPFLKYDVDPRKHCAHHLYYMGLPPPCSRN